MLVALIFVLFSFSYFSWIIFFLSWWKWADSYSRLSSLSFLFVRIFSVRVSICSSSGRVVRFVRRAAWDSSFSVKYLLKYFDTFIGLLIFLFLSFSRFSRNYVFLIRIFGVLCFYLFFCTRCLHLNVFNCVFGFSWSRIFCGWSLVLIRFVLLVFFAHVLCGSF